MNINSRIILHAGGIMQIRNCTVMVGTHLAGAKCPAVASVIYKRWLVMLGNCSL